MTERYYKTTRLDGTDFRTGTVKYEVGKVVSHPTTKLVKEMAKDEPFTYLSVSVVPTDCTGMRWPCRLFVVEGVKPKRALTSNNLPNKRCFVQVRVVEELPSWQVFGPYGEQVVEIIERVKNLSLQKVRDLDAARDAVWDAIWDAAWGAAWGAAWDAARGAARDAIWDAARGAARDATLAWLSRDLITSEQFSLLYGPWLSVVGEPRP